MRNLKLAATLVLLSAIARLASAQSQFPPPQPTIPAGTYNVTNYGAVGDGVTVNTTSIQSAIAAAAASPAKGGTVEIPGPGTYLCGPLTMKSSINLQVDAGATLQMLPYASWPGTTTFINGSGLHDVEISGAGIIDGQGADWWAAYNSNKISRPNFINFSGTTRILIQNITLQNPPTFHLMLKGNNSNITIQGITINTPGTSPNTDGMDLASTNVLVQNSYISDGDDNIEIGGSQLCAYVTVTNCAFGTGHGVSVGSITSGGVSNILVTDCTFTNTANAIRMKSDNDRGGVVQNLKYLNLAMTNVNFPVTIYSYYNEVGTPSSVTPLQAATEPVPSATNTTPLWRNITLSNITGSASSGNIAGIVWGRSELPATNITFCKVNLTASKSFDLYNASAITFIDCQFTLPAGVKTFQLYNAQVTLTNSTSGGIPATFDGLTTNSIGNTIALYNMNASWSNTNVLDAGPLTLGGSVLTVSGDFNLIPSTVLNFLLGTNNSEVVVTGNLTLGGTVNATNAAGFAPGTYTLLGYSGALGGTFPTLGAAPAGHTYNFDTNTVGQVKLKVGPSLTPVNLISQSSASQLTLSWPADHTGWRLQIQTNASKTGLGTNWTTVANSQTTNQIVIPLNPVNGSVFLRLVYP